MADKALSSLTAASTLDGTELAYVVQSSNSRKVTLSTLLSFAHSQAWSGVTSTPTTLSGYGITDAQAKDSDLTAIAALSASDGGFMVGDGTTWTVETGSTARASLGVAIGTDVQAYNAGLADIAGLAKTDGAVIIGDGTNWTLESGATLRTSMGLSIGSDVQAYDAALTSLAGLSLSSGDILYSTGSSAFTNLAKGSDGQVLALVSGLPSWTSVTGTGDMIAAVYDPDGTGGSAFDQDNMVDGTTNKNYPATDKTKVDHLTVTADIDLDNAVLNTATDASGFGFVIDDDTMATASATKLSSSESTKAYADSFLEGTKLVSSRGSTKISPYDYGADPADAFTVDQSAAVQAMLDALSDSWDATDQAFGVEVDGGGRPWVCASEVGFVQDLHPGAVIRNLHIHSTNTGGIALNLGGTNSPTLINVRVHGDTTNTPALGIYYGLVDSGTIASPTGVFPAASEVKMIGCKTSGAFSKAAVWAMGSEVETLVGCFFSNRHRSDTATTYINTSDAGCFEDRLGAVTSDLVVLPTASLGAKSNVCHNHTMLACIRTADFTLSITGATQANPCVLSFDSTALTNAAISNGDSVFIHNVSGMTELNGKNYIVANINNAAGTFELQGTDSSAYGLFTTTTQGYCVNKTGPAAIFEGVALLDSKGGYYIANGAPGTLSVDLRWGGVTRNWDISLQAETQPLSLIFFRMDANNETIYGPFKVNCLASSQSFANAVFDKTSGGTLTIESLEYIQTRSSSVPTFQLFHLPTQVALRNCNITLPATGLFNTYTNFVSISGVLKINGSSPSVTFFGDQSFQNGLFVGGTKVVDASKGFRLPTYTATQIADITHAVNTTDKVLGKAVYDTTNRRTMVAQGSTAAGSWYVADGSASVTPV